MFKNPNFQDKNLWLIWLIFLSVVWWGIFNHQPWRDEAQAWLIARDLSVTEIFQQMPYEGSPPLWHLMLAPLAKSGLPYETMHLIHGLIASVGIFIFLFYAPLPKILKLILPFGYYFSFEYAVIARNYNLSILLLFALAACYQKRLTRPLTYATLIFLLSWTNTHSLAVAGLLSVGLLYDLIKENKWTAQKFISGLLSFSGPISALITMIPHVDQQYAGWNFLGTDIIAWSLSAALLPFLVSENLLIDIGVLAWIIALAWLPLSLLLLKGWRTRIAFYLSYGWLSTIFMFKLMGDLRHYGLILVFFIFFWWLDSLEQNQPGASLEKINLSEKKLLNNIGLILISSFLIASLLYSVYFRVVNQDKYFSGAQEMAKYLLSNPHLLQENIATFPAYSGSALLPYLANKDFYQLDTFREGTFLTWDNMFLLGRSSSHLFLKEQMEQYYVAKGAKLEHVLFLTIIPPGLDPELELIYQNTKSTVKSDEFFYLYRLPLNRL